MQNLIQIVHIGKLQHFYWVIFKFFADTMELFDLNLAVCNQCIFSYHLMKFETTAKEITATVSYY